MERRSKEPRFAEVPERVAFTLRMPPGVLSHASCSLGTSESRHLEMIAREGSFEIDNAFAYRGFQTQVRRAGKADGRPRDVVEPKLEEKDLFATEPDAFAQAILQHEPVRTPGADGLADLKVAAIEEAARSGRPVKVG